MSLKDRFLKIIENGMRSDEEIDPKVRAFLSDIIDRWSFVVTPFVLDNPSEKFQKVVYFYQKGLAIEKSGRLVAAKMFSFANPDVFRKTGTEESIKEIAANIIDLKWNPFDTKMPLSPKKWEDIQNDPETIKSSFRLFDQMMWKNLNDFSKIENVPSIKGFEDFDYNNEKDMKIIFQIGKIKKYIFSDTVGGVKVEDLKETRGDKTYTPRGDMNRSIKKAFISEYSDYLKGRSFDAMNEFSESFDKSVSSLTQKNDASVLLYNKFMGFKGNERNKDVGKVLEMINERFPWSLNFTGEFDTEMSETLIKEIEEMKDEGKSKKDIDEHIHNRLVDAIEKNHQISRKTIVMIENCFNDKEYMGLGSLRKLTENFSKNSEAKNLFSDISENMFQELVVASLSSKEKNDATDIMDEARIKMFNKMRHQKSIFESLGMTCELKLPDNIKEVDMFISNGKLNKVFQNVISKERVTLYAHELLQNVLSTPIRNTVPLTTKEILNVVYKDGIKVSDLVKTILRAELLRTKDFITDIDHMKNIADVPLPSIPGLSNRYTITHNNKFYHIEFPETLNDIKGMMSWNTVEGGFDGGNKANYVTGDMRKLYGVLGQRVISQSTSYMVSDNKEIKKPFIIRSESDVSSCIPYAYGEIDIMALTKKIPEKIFSMIMIDDMNTDKDEISKVLAKMKTINMPTLKYEDIKRGRENNLLEISKNKGDRPLIVPLKNESVHEWIKIRGVFPNLKEHEQVSNKLREISNDIENNPSEVDHEIENDF